MRVHSLIVTISLQQDNTMVTKISFNSVIEIGQRDYTDVFNSIIKIGWKVYKDVFNNVKAMGKFKK